MFIGCCVLLVSKSLFEGLLPLPGGDIRLRARPCVDAPAAGGAIFLLTAVCSRGERGPDSKIGCSTAA